METSAFLNTVYEDLMAPPFRGFLKLYEYSLLEVSIELTESMIDEMIRHANDWDPSGRSRFCQVARELRRLVETITFPLRNLIECHRYGRIELLKAAAAGGFKRPIVHNTT